MKLFMTEKRLQAELEKRADSFTDQVVNSVLSANASSAVSYTHLTLPTICSV